MTAEPENELRERAIGHLKKKDEFAHHLRAYGAGERCFGGHLGAHRSWILWR